MYNIQPIMAEIHARRRLRVRQLIEERFEGNHSLMGRATGVSHHMISFVLRGGANLGERAARKIEAALGLAGGWMDRELPPGAVPKTPYKARRGGPPIRDPIVRARRRLRLSRIVEERFDGGEVAMSRAVGLSHGTISNVVAGRVFFCGCQASSAA